MGQVYFILAFGKDSKGKYVYNRRIKRSQKFFEQIPRLPSLKNDQEKRKGSGSLQASGSEKIKWAIFEAEGTYVSKIVKLILVFSFPGRWNRCKFSMFSLSLPLPLSLFASPCQIIVLNNFKFKKLKLCSLLS